LAYDLIAAVDLGSNSFRLQVGRVVGNQIYPLDGLKEAVRLASGLTPEKLLDAAAQARGLEALARFGELLRGLAPGAVRAVATNTLSASRLQEGPQNKCEERDDCSGSGAVPQRGTHLGSFSLWRGSITMW
jgi:hypothetical protein